MSEQQQSTFRLKLVSPKHAGLLALGALVLYVIVMSISIQGHYNALFLGFVPILIVSYIIAWRKMANGIMDIGLSAQGLNISWTKPFYGDKTIDEYISWGDVKSIGEGEGRNFLCLAIELKTGSTRRYYVRSSTAEMAEELIIQAKALLKNS